MVVTVLLMLGDHLWASDPPLVEDNLRWKTTFVGSLHAAKSTLRHFFFVILELTPLGHYHCNMCILHYRMHLSN